MRACLVAALIGLAACGGDDSDDHGLLTSGGGGVQFTASGEVLALGGYAFPPATADDPAFVDGWNIRFEKLIVVVASVALSEAPDSSTSDQALTGKRVTVADGPWAIDLHQGGPLAGKGGSDEESTLLAIISGKSLDPTERYAFSFDTMPATDTATLVHVEANDPDYAAMVMNGWNTLYVGTATFRGTDCTSADPSFDFTQLPTSVHFRFGFTSPVSYLNCQNPDNDPADPLGDEEHQRGIQVKSNATTTAQVTIHSDHPFWDSLLHDAPARFDALAALAHDGEVTLADTRGVDYHAMTFNGAPLPWRSCIAGQTWPSGDTQVNYDDLGASVEDFAAFMTYNQSTQGHLNSDGLCFVKRNYESAR